MSCSLYASERVGAPPDLAHKQMIFPRCSHHCKHVSAQTSAWCPNGPHGKFRLQHPIIHNPSNLVGRSKWRRPHTPTWRPMVRSATKQGCWSSMSPLSIIGQMSSRGGQIVRQSLAPSSASFVDGGLGSRSCRHMGTCRDAPCAVSLSTPPHTILSVVPMTAQHSAIMPHGSVCMTFACNRAYNAAWKS